MSLTIDTRQTPVTATLSGELSVITLGDLQDELFGLLNFSVLTLDLTLLEMLDGCGAQLIAILQQEAGQQGKQLRLEAAEGSQARHVLSLMGLWPADHGEGHADGYQ
ncbi:STAS domain-containing protein [Aeromonas hydrophila]|uniref:STAS domain-containing protein n=1 Tax=Aeromonas hydrophila TaxID=644 RepID=UPI001FC7D1F1|nr:STAS domain-containing protein [Aeromonas hydrophila]GKQ98642.1 anti-anti-sigma factor family protein [Aeromonas hydrophila]